MSRHGLLRTTLLAVMLSCATTAPLLLAPQHAAAQSDAMARAQQHYEKGVEWYAAGDYPKAIVEFLKGYNLAPNAMFLYNISLSYQKLGNYQEALRAAVRASGEQGFPAGYSTRNDARITAFRRIVEAQDAAVGIERAASQVADASDPGDPSDPVTPEPAIPRAEPSGFGALGWTGAAAAVLGAGALVGVAVINSGLQGDIEELEAAGQPGWDGDKQSFDTLYADVESRTDTGKLLLYGGSGLLAVGAVLVAIDLLSGGESEGARQAGASSLRIAPTDGGFAVGHGFRF